MRKTCFILFLLCLSLLSQAQNKIWYFGGRCGLDFTSGAPVPLNNGQMTATEGCISLSDPAGNIIFYSNGDSIWDRNHNWMANSVGPGFGGYSCSQSTLAVRKPGSTTIFYMFYQAAQGGANGFRYVEVDMTLNGGNGDVASNSLTQLLSQSCEQLTAVRHSNGIDVWVIVHGLNSNSFYSYLVSGSGVSSTPIVSSVGTTINASFNMVETIGCMKVSCDGMHLAVAHYGDSITELFNFNRSTGIISNPQVLSTSYAPYGVEFSSNNTYLYISEWNSFGAAIYQYDLSATNIAASQTQIGTVSAASGAAGALQIGPDHKIYCAILFNDSLAVINNPDLPGSSCGFVNNGLWLGGGISLYGLPNFITGGYCIPSNPDAVEETNLADLISVYPNPVSDVLIIDAGKLADQYAVSITNAISTLVYTSNSSDELMYIDLTAFPGGIYFLRVESDGRYFTKKIILE